VGPQPVESSATVPDHWFTEVSSARLILRRFQPDEAPLLTALDSDPEVKRFIDGGAPARPDLDREAIARICRQYDEIPGFGTFAAHRRDTGAFIGWFHFRPDKEDPLSMDLGYRLMRNAWGQGFATEGSRSLIERGFLQQNVPQVVAHALIGNKASWSVMEKLGMKRVREYEEERFPLADKRALRYAMTRAEFDASRNTTSGVARK
jgi:RimJ/RimL family protein N-acetyltransferase